MIKKKKSTSGSYAFGNITSNFIQRKMLFKLLCPIFTYFTLQVYFFIHWTKEKEKSNLFRKIFIFVFHLTNKKKYILLCWRKKGWGWGWGRGYIYIYIYDNTISDFHSKTIVSFLILITETAWVKKKRGGDKTNTNYY